jgi:hypothetical protein
MFHTRRATQFGSGSLLGLLEVAPVDDGTEDPGNGMTFDMIL